MPGQAGLVKLSAGSVLRLDGTEWAVAAIEAWHGRVLLKAGGDERWRSIRWLVHHPDCQSVPDGDAERARPAGQPPTMEDLTGYQREVAQMRVAHLLEAETGFRGGDPLRPGPGEPRPLYDPRRTTLRQRRRAKAAELRPRGKDRPQVASRRSAATRLARLIGKPHPRRGTAHQARGNPTSLAPHRSW